MMTQEELSRLHHEAEIELKKYPGVVGVGYGAKEKGGKTTDQIAFRVYVVEKKSLSDLQPEEIIPSDFKAIPTDVIKVPVFKKFHCEDLATHSPLIGGISIANMRISGGGIGAGTLGCFATINGVAGPENVVLLSNNHVLMDGGAQVGDTIFQPRFIESGGVVQADTNPQTQNPVGKIHNAGLDGHYHYQYAGPGETAADYWIDCATAQLDISISSWCHTNCGVHFKNEIRDLNINGNSAIASVARAQALETVYKVGRTTSRTKGRVIEVTGTGEDADTHVLQNRILVIEPTENDCNGRMQFSDTGDSGSAIINGNNQIVGLLFGGNPNRTTACHIHPLIDKLGITIITSANPHSAADTLSDAPGLVVDGSFNHIPALKERFLSTEQGRELFGLVLAHRAEAVELVNRRRPVTVAWHRSKGPAFLSHLVNNARDPEHVVPREIEGVSRESLIRNMARALSAHGSAALQAVVAQHFDEALAYAERCDSLHELVELLNFDTMTR